MTNNIRCKHMINREPGSYVYQGDYTYKCNHCGNVYLDVDERKADNDYREALRKLRLTNPLNK